MQPPAPDEIVEALFSEIIEPPEGYEYYPFEVSKQLMYPVYGQDRWRVLLHKKGTAIENANNFRPIYLDGAFVRGVSKALNAIKTAMDAAISDEIPDKVNGDAPH